MVSTGIQTAQAKQRKFHATTQIMCTSTPADHPFLSSYSVNSITQTSANQLARTDIRVNALCPGLIETGMTSMVMEYAKNKGTAAKVGQLNPLGRYGVAEGTSFVVIVEWDGRMLMFTAEIAAVALFLASGELSHLSVLNLV
jgi:NAD(P)-dependent dehydrogenase (short-subunit alcohol dehydrogenase family)